MNQSHIPPTSAPQAEEPCPIPRWSGSPQQEIQVIRRALARHRALLDESNRYYADAQSVIVEADRQLGLNADRGSLLGRLEERLVEAERRWNLSLEEGTNGIESALEAMLVRLSLLMASMSSSKEGGEQ